MAACKARQKHASWGMDPWWAATIKQQPPRVVKQSSFLRGMAFQFALPAAPTSSLHALLPLMCSSRMTSPYGLAFTLQLPASIALTIIRAAFLNVGPVTVAMDICLGLGCPPVPGGGGGGLGANGPGDRSFQCMFSSSEPARFCLQKLHYRRSALWLPMPVVPCSFGAQPTFCSTGSLSCLSHVQETQKEI